MEELLEIYIYKLKNLHDIKILKVSLLEQTETLTNISVQVVVCYNNVSHIEYITFNKKDYNTFLRMHKINKILKR